MKPFNIGTLLVLFIVDSTVVLALDNGSSCKWCQEMCNNITIYAKYFEAILAQNKVITPEDVWKLKQICNIQHGKFGNTIPKCNDLDTSQEPRFTLGGGNATRFASFRAQYNHGTEGIVRRQTELGKEMSYFEVEINFPKMAISSEEVLRGAEFRLYHDKLNVARSCHPDQLGFYAFTIKMIGGQVGDKRHSLVYDTQNVSFIGNSGWLSFDAYHLVQHWFTDSTLEHSLTFFGFTKRVPYNGLDHFAVKPWRGIEYGNLLPHMLIFYDHRPQN